MAVCACGCAGCIGHANGTGEGSLALLTSETSGDSNIDSVVYSVDNKWGPKMMGLGQSVTFSFMESLPSYHEADSSFTVFNEAMKTAARSALDAWAAVSNLSFVEVSDAGDGGQIRFGANYQASSAGYAYFPSSSEIGGDVMIANNYDYNLDPVEGGYGYLTMLHEVGHAIGLKHPGNYSSSTAPYLDSSIDNTDTTVMSYNDGTQYYPSTLGWLDIQAVQYMYGRTETGTLGNVTWGEDTAETFAGDSGVNYYFGYGGADLFQLGGGNDGAMAGNGNDTLSGGTGDDLLYGNIGVDLMFGGSGADTMFGGQNEGATQTYGQGTTLAYREGSDTLSGGAGSDLIYGNHGGDLLVGGTDGDTIFGGQESDTISGGDGWDELHGNLGDDSIIGGANSDYIYGGAGNDTLTGDGGNDRFFIQEGGGNDTVTDFTYFTDYLAVQANINATGIASTSDVIARATQSGSDVVFDFGSGQTVTLLNYTTAQLVSADILVF
jgi:serralysin